MTPAASTTKLRAPQNLNVPIAPGVADLKPGIGLDGVTDDLFPAHNIPPDLVIQLQMPVSIFPPDPNAPPPPIPDPTGCLPAASADLLRDLVRSQMQDAMPGADVQVACTPLHVAQRNPIDNSSVLRTATTIGIWSRLPIPGEDRAARLAEFDLFEGGDTGVFNLLAAFYVSGRFLRAQLAAGMAGMTGFDIDQQTIKFDGAAGTVTTTVAGHRIRKSGKEGRRTFTLRWTESAHGVERAFARCDAPPPAIEVTAERNFTGNLLDFFKPNAIPELAVLGALVRSGLFVPRVAIPRENPDDPDEPARALDFDYEEFRIRSQGPLEGLTVIATANPETRQPCAVISGPTSFTVREGQDQQPRYRAVARDMREPIRAQWSGERVTALTPNLPTTRVRFDVSSIQNGGTITARLQLHLEDADGLVSDGELLVRVNVPFVVAPPRPH